MTLGPPTVHCYLDDGSGTYPTDISSRVDLDPDNGGLQLEGYGRADEFDYAGGTELTVVLNNTDGALTVGGTPISKRQGIRITLTKGATTKNRFTGKIDGADLGWPGGLGKLANLVVTALDPIADCGNFTMRSMLEHEILLRSPFAYYTLGEPAGATGAGDTSGVGGPLLTPGGVGTPPVFGAGTGPVDGLPAVQFAGGGYLGVQTANAYVTPAVPFSFVIFLSTTTIPGGGGATVLSVYPVPGTAINDVASVIIDSAGRLRITVGVGQVATTGSIADGDIHCIVGTYDGAGTVTGYVDGVTVGNDATGTLLHTGVDVSVGDYGLDPSDGEQFTGWASHLAFYATALSASDAANIASAGLTGCAGETTDARFARLASYGGFPTTTTTGLSGQTVGVQDTSDSTLLTALQQVADSEIGVLYANGSGVLVLQGRGYRSAKTVADLILAGTQQELGADTTVTLDDQQQLLLVTVTDATGATQTVGAGLPSKELTVLDDNSGDALRTAQWLTVKHADPGPRLPAATLDPYTSSVAEQILQREIGDRLAFTGLPTQTWANLGDATIEGWSETVTQDEWQITANLLPWSLFTALVLDDATYGALDSYPLMP